MAANITTLHRKRGAIKSKLTTLKTFVNDCKNQLPLELQTEKLEEVIHELQIRYDNTSLLSNSFNEIQSEIECICEEENLETEYASRNEFETNLYAVQGTMSFLLAKYNSNNHLESTSIHSNSNQASSSIESHVTKQRVKLPTIKLPTFNGNWEKWVEFRDTFESLINKNETIQDIEKFHYLRASLEGAAAQVIKSLELSSQNYINAWQTLCERFNNNKLLIFNHIKSIFDIQSISKPTSKGLRQIADETSKNLRSLSSLNVPIESWDVLIIFIISNKLDRDTLKHWEERSNSNELPSLKDFLQILNVRADFLETVESRDISKVQSKGDRKVTMLSEKHTCNFCQKEHLIYHCPTFLKLSASARIEETKKNKLCLNCLKPGHVLKSCLSSSCRKCKSKHNTLLHINKQNESITKDQTETTSEEKTQTFFGQSADSSESLLPTAEITVRTKNRELHKCRALLDSCSQSHFITASLAEKLKLKQSRAMITVSGINGSVSKVSSRCDVSIMTRDKRIYTINCNIVPKICQQLPSETFDPNMIRIPDNISLADPHFHKSNNIDILIGNSLFWHLLRDGRITHGQKEPIFQNTQFGWIIAGAMNLPSMTTNNIVCNLSTNQQLLDQLQVFWDIEDNVTQSTLSVQDQLCEELFQKTHTRDKEGRFIVSIPFKDNPSKLGSSKATALKQFYSIERKLQNNPKLHAQYCAFMKEYELMGHMVKLEHSIDDTKDHYYIPHHAVMRPESLTTKLRVVFNASCPTDTGYSLNQLQYIGPQLLQDLFSILIRFRLKNVVIIADIAKMYRQILIRPEDRNYQLIFWRENPSDELNTYQLNTVTYGTASAPYLALRCIKQTAEESKQQFPDASKILQQDMYVDDLITGVETISDAIQICNDIVQILKTGCFELRKWGSNKPELFKFADIGSQDLLTSLQNMGDNTIKTLGLEWSSHSDSLCYRIMKQEPKRATKRSILAKISKIFDPLGLLSPCVITTKIIIQQLWSLQSSWDEEIPNDLQTKWERYEQNLESLNSLTIPRQVTHPCYIHFQLHGFSDASQQAYAACIFARTQAKDGTIVSNLLCAKSKVAPVKTTTIPRLELCGALLLSKLMQKVIKAIDQTPECFYWTDSKITLCWIQSQSSNFQTFVANRVGEIQSLTEKSKWKHVSSKDNPADIASRGISPEETTSQTLWWHGPSWLSQEEQFWPPQEQEDINYNELPDTRKCTLLSTIAQTNPFFERYSDLSRLKRIVALCLRFKKNCKQEITRNSKNNIIPSFTVEELNEAFNLLLRLAQLDSFQSETQQLKHNQRTRLVRLSPFIDSDGLLKVGGRIQNSSSTIYQKHPVLLSNKHKLSHLIMRYEHEKLYHGGPQLTLSSVRTRFWILNGRSLARKIVHNCIRCFKANPRSETPVMGNLPTHRVQPSFPFLATGTDYAGPFLVREREGRGKKRFKCYICLFICLVTKAVHLEVVTNLTTNSFLETLKRFVSRRGKPRHLYSDNGTQYVGANNDLKELFMFLKTNETYLSSKLANDEIEWHFIPPNSPNFGGLWEAAIKSAKSHLKRVLGNTFLTLENFMTVLVGIEGILNSRPLSPMSSDPNDYEPLTPAHFLIGRPLHFVAEPNLTHLPSGRTRNFQQLQQLQQHFWARWSKEYLSELQQRTKPSKLTVPVTKGQLVLIKDDNVPPYCWKLGRISELHPGNDGIIRVVTIKTTSGTMKRAVSRICQLPTES